MTGIRLRHLTFTGTNIEPAELEFDDGLNIIFGASNTGKSFTSKAILFMLGVSKTLPEIDEIKAYSAAWLGMTLADKSHITLYRSTDGGNFKLYEGLVKNADPMGGVLLRQKHDSKRTDSVSQMLLAQMGFTGKQIVRDGYGTKAPLTIYLLSPYAVVSEGDIIAEKSPVFLSGSPSERTLEQNLFKFLITGKDDSAAVTVPKLSDRKVAKAAKIELVDELIAQIDVELGKNLPNLEETKNQLERLEQSADDLFAELQTAQKLLDRLLVDRRNIIEQRRDVQNKANELDLTIQRFAKLNSVYSSDLQRLQSIEEGGFLLLAMSGMDCPVCGAISDNQKHNHTTEDISIAYKAAAAEAKKIEREQLELTQTMVSLKADTIELEVLIAKYTDEIENLDSTINETRPVEASLRERYEAYSEKRAEITRILELYQQKAKLLARRAEIEKVQTSRNSDTQPVVGPDSTTVFNFGETVKAVLTAWHFPGADKVQFDSKTNDITVAGKRRTANGKGVRAILHAAFNVAVIVYCIDNKLPHPGFLILDTPLLTYREPISSRHGELSEDEAALKVTSLAEHFYKHLASLKDDVQFIVIENSTPPKEILGLARVETFTRVEGNGRYGLLERNV
ncbi:hypothetical protein [Rheinheimera aquimaris]|uniref:hypothetical protein n=1 Tax=Rheinheimera aquimaris TaxID=412437 RepID=UPI003A97F5CA